LLGWIVSCASAHAQDMPPGVQQLIESEKLATQARLELERAQKKQGDQGDKGRFEFQGDGDKITPKGDKTFWALNNLRL